MAVLADYASKKLSGNLKNESLGDFLEKEVPAIRRKMELLGLDAKIFN